MAAADAPYVNYLLKPFAGNKNNGDTTRIKLYLQSTKEVDKEFVKLDIPVSNSKDIIYHFLSISKKYVWGHLASVVKTGAGTKNIFRVVY